MTADEKKLDRLFDVGVGVLHDKCRDFHYPRRECFDGSCERYGLSIGTYWYRKCNWVPLLDRIVEFFNGAPDVTGAWKAKVREIGLTPNALHDLLLGVFLGSDCERPAITEYYVSATKAKRITLSVSESFLRENPYPGGDRAPSPRVYIPRNPTLKETS